MLSSSSVLSEQIVRALVSDSHQFPKTWGFWGLCLLLFLRSIFPPGLHFLLPLLIKLFLSQNHLLWDYLLIISVAKQ